MFFKEEAKYNNNNRTTNTHTISYSRESKNAFIASRRVVDKIKSNNHFVPLFIGVLILFALTCTNFSAKLDAGTCLKFQLGGKSSMLPLVGLTTTESWIGFRVNEAVYARSAE